MNKHLQFADWLRELASSSNHPFVQNSERMVQYFFELENKLPSTFSWCYMSKDDFKKYCSQLTEKIRRSTEAKEIVDELNRAYWHDMAHNIEAYSFLTFFRAAEELESAIKLLNQRYILSPAIVSRSLLELGANIITYSNRINKTIKEITRFRSKLKGAYHSLVSTELEELLVRLIWGTGVHQLEGYPKAINSAEYRKFVAENSNAREFREVYNFLCDLTHPNMLGYARFLGGIIAEKENGSKLVKIERYAESMLTRHIREKILWALSWSSVCIRNGVEINLDSVQIILNAWPK